jgi:MYXO-CTERM domain-containing protein
MRSDPWLAAGLIGLSLVLSAQAAQAFCRTTTCDANVEDCTPPDGGCVTKGLPLYWPMKCTSYNLQKDATAGITFDQFQQTAALSFGAWTQVDCGGAAPSIQVSELAPISEALACYNQNAPNVNAVLFQSVKWPYNDSNQTLALTTVTYNTETGEIYDVDMEINSATAPITVSDTDIKYDLQSILTHEAGHFYGLAHHEMILVNKVPTCSAPSTMCPTYASGSTTLRTLQADDVAGICTIYPSDRAVDPNCDPTPRHGFGTACGDPPEDTGSGCCSTTPSRSSGHGSGALAAAMLGWVLLRSRRRR